jgi:FKBP-type peptidyl-prolyl cis-trans isomerase FkpA
MQTNHSLSTLLALTALPLALVACKSTDIRRDEPPVYRPTASSPNQPLPPVAAPSAQRKPTLNQQPPVVTPPPQAASLPAPQYTPNPVPVPAPAPVPQARSADWDQVTSGQTSPNASIAPAAGNTQAPAVDANFRQVPVEGSDPTKPLRVKDERIGTGAEAGRKNVVLIHYTGWLYDSTKPDLKGERFDTSRKSNDPQGNVPLGFIMGSNRVVKGMEEGVVGMRVGGRRTVIIPPQLGYGEKGGGPIPPNATMIFDIELVRVQ